MTYRWFAIIRAPNGDYMEWTKAKDEATAVESFLPNKWADWDMALAAGYRLDYVRESLNEDAPALKNVAGRITHGRGAVWA